MDAHQILSFLHIPTKWAKNIYWQKRAFFFSPRFVFLQIMLTIPNTGPFIREANDRSHKTIQQLENCSKKRAWFFKIGSFCTFFVLGMEKGKGEGDKDDDEAPRFVEPQNWRTYLKAMNPCFGFSMEPVNVKNVCYLYIANSTWT